MTFSSATLMAHRGDVINDGDAPPAMMVPSGACRAMVPSAVCTIRRAMSGESATDGAGSRAIAKPLVLAAGPRNPAGLRPIQRPIELPWPPNSPPCGCSRAAASATLASASR